MGAPPKALLAAAACVSPPSTAFRGPTGSSSEGHSGGVRMRFPLPVQRFVAPWAAPSKAQWL
eukprot:1884914-Pyramimonas_sp.AAC.1